MQSAVYLRLLTLDRPARPALQIDLRMHIGRPARALLAAARTCGPAPQLGPGYAAASPAGLADQMIQHVRSLGGGDAQAIDILQSGLAMNVAPQDAAR
jgi:hypothetical protein